MKWFLDITTRGKLFAGFGLMIAFLATVIVTAYLGISAIQESQKNFFQNVAGTRQAEVAAQGLHELGQRLKQLAAQYKV